MAANLVPNADFTKAIRSTDDSPAVPQIVAHRGQGGDHPENTMGAFRSAVGLGANALECDVQLSRDHAVVLSHDISLKRCYGHKHRISKCNWDFLSTIRTLAEPHNPLPRFSELLAFLAKPENQHVWVFLDIKFYDNADELVRGVADVIASIPSGHRPWSERIILACWTAAYLSPVQTHLPGFPIAIITASLPYARKFLNVPLVRSFSVNRYLLLTSSGRKFADDARKAGKTLSVWTVNQSEGPSSMRWTFGASLDAVISDKPGLFMRLREELETTMQGQAPLTAADQKIPSGVLLKAYLILVVSSIFGCLVSLYHRSVLGKFQSREKPRPYTQKEPSSPPAQSQRHSIPA